MISQFSLPIDHTELSLRVERMFIPLCEILSADAATQLGGEVEQHLVEIRKALRSNEFLDIALAEQIAGALAVLLAEYDTMSEEYRALVVGAARYFVSDQDAESDLNSILGCDDDAEVLNHVLDLIGREELKVAI